MSVQMCELSARPRAESDQIRWAARQFYSGLAADLARRQRIGCANEWQLLGELSQRIRAVCLQLARQDRANLAAELRRLAGERFAAAYAGQRPVIAELLSYDEDAGP